MGAWQMWGGCPYTTGGDETTYLWKWGCSVVLTMNGCDAPACLASHCSQEEETKLFVTGKADLMFWESERVCGVTDLSCVKLSAGLNHPMCDCFKLSSSIKVLKNTLFCLIKYWEFKVFNKLVSYSLEHFTAGSERQWEEEHLFVILCSARCVSTEVVRVDGEEERF